MALLRSNFATKFGDDFGLYRLFDDKSLSDDSPRVRREPAGLLDEFGLVSIPKSRLTTKAVFFVLI